MKFALVFITLCTFLMFCDNNHHGVNHPTIIIEKSSGLVISRAVDSFEISRGLYHVFTVVKNTTNKKIDMVQITAKYCNEDGRELARSVGEPGHILKAGDSVIVDNQYIFPTINDLVYKVKISVSDDIK